MPGPVLNTFHVPTHLVSTATLLGLYEESHFTDEGTRALKRVGNVSKVTKFVGSL